MERCWRIYVWFVFCFVDEPEKVSAIFVHCLFRLVYRTNWLRDINGRNKEMRRFAYDQNVFADNSLFVCCYRACLWKVSLWMIVPCRRSSLSFTLLSISFSFTIQLSRTWSSFYFVLWQLVIRYELFVLFYIKAGWNWLLYWLISFFLITSLKLVNAVCLYTFKPTKYIITFSHARSIKKIV